MIYLFIILLLLILVCFLFDKCNSLNKKKLEELKEYYKADLIDLEKEKEKKEREAEISSAALTQIKEEVKDATERLDKYNELVKIQKDYSETLEKQNAQIEQTQKAALDQKIAVWAKEGREQIINENITFKGLLEKQTNELIAARDNQLLELQKILDQLDEYQEKVNTVNTEILRRRAIEEKQDFYRIVLSAETSQDIAAIQSIREKLNKREFLDKMVYDNYISKSVKEMCKRVLGNEDPSGIYRITNIETQESYIGKSTTVATRWTNHIKSACGLSGVADSQFQRALRKYGIDKWTFELLEKCPKEKLTEREKYYISFYDTITYGYNQRLG